MSGQAKDTQQRLIVGVTGASGAPLALGVLKALKEFPIQIHLIISPGTKQTFEHELSQPLSALEDLADQVHDARDLAAPPASGSWRNAGMVIVPCSMKTLAGIYAGYGDNLLLRSADVALKERRKLVLVTRETPLSGIHLRNMLELTRLGAVILPPMLSYYNRPNSLEQATAHIVGKILDQFGLSWSGFQRWGEE